MQIAAELIQPMASGEKNLTPVAAPPPSQLYRLPVRADGRCSTRAVLAAAGVHPPEGGSSRSSDDFAFIREQRLIAAECLASRMGDDDDLCAIVHGSFPDECYESYEDWHAAQLSDDTDQAISDLWRGGGEWVLYGLALYLRLKIVVHNVDATSRSLIDASADGAELVDARPAEGGGTTVHLASMRADDGTPNHFDILLVDGPQPGCEPIGRSRAAASPARFMRSLASSSRPSGLLIKPSQSVQLLAWAALNVLALSMCMSWQQQPLATGGQEAAASSLISNLSANLALLSRSLPELVFGRSLVTYGNEHELLMESVRLSPIVRHEPLPMILSSA